MPLIPAAVPAVEDARLSSVRFVMKDGSRPVSILVSRPALEEVDGSPSQSCFETFKRYRKCFERIASDKYSRGHVEQDGTVCIRAIDLPLVSSL
jgi:hypothetical protein